MTAFMAGAYSTLAGRGAGVHHGGSGGSSSGWEFWLGLVFILLVLAFLGVRQLSRRSGR